MFSAYNEDAANVAMRLVLPAAEAMVRIDGLCKRQDFTMQLARREGTSFATLATRDLGDPESWEHPYDAIANGKLAITARTGLPSRLVHLVHPDLLESTDVRYWGSWIDSPNDIIIAACSGVQPWFDEMISKMLVAAAKGVVENDMKRIDQLREETGGDFLDGKLAVRLPG